VPHRPAHRHAQRGTGDVGPRRPGAFPAGSQTQRLDATRVAAPPGVAPHLGTPADGSFSALATFSRDAGTIDIAAGVAKLDEAYRAFEAIGAAVRSQASVTKTTVDS